MSGSAGYDSSPYEQIWQSPKELGERKSSKDILTQWGKNKTLTTLKE